ncbi:MAG: phosphatase [Firmicutes bacterium]|nr:phosphatase [Bacillota bacterium]
MPKFAGDLHTHSLASGHAYSTISEMAGAAAKKGLAYLGLTEHGPNLPSAPHIYYFGNLKVIPPQIQGVNILKGVEANIISPAGELDLPNSLLENLDWVLVGYHPDAGFGGGSVETNTQAMIKAVTNPYVDALVHPGNPIFPVDYEAVVKACAEHGKAIEINNASLTVVRTGSRPNCTRIATLAARYKVKVILSSDAHYADDVGKLDAAYELATSCGIADEQIVNLTVRGIEEFLVSRGKKPRVDSTTPAV